MVHSIPFSQAEYSQLIPHAILKRPVSFFVQKMNAWSIVGQDDLDSYEATAAILNGKIVFAIKHYRGEPENTSTIFLPKSLAGDVPSITAIIVEIVHEFDLSARDITWQRKDNPEL
jgi:hypothetical protein